MAWALPPALADLRRESFQPIPAARHQDDLQAFPGQPSGCGRANARGGPGHDGKLIFPFVFHGS